MTIENHAFNPFPGLRPFGYEDRKYYYGRESQIKDVTDKILKKHFITIIGSSGSGKSSLINAGVIPEITEVINKKEISSLRVVSIKPGISPIENFAKALTENANVTGVKDNLAIQTGKISWLLRNSPDGLAESLRQTAKDSKERVILVIDQFEDLFRFKRSRNNRNIIHENEDFIKLIVEAQKQDHVPVYILIAIRSDFIEEIQQFQDLNRLVNDSNYIIPEMSKEEMQKAIYRPAELLDYGIDTKLVNKLLNDVRDKTDKLPLLQHSLNRTWEQWMRQKKNERLVTVEDYDAVGGMDNALIRHADETYQELSDTGRIICERIFKTITEKGTDNQETSIPVRISEIALISHVGVADIIDVIERFREPDRSFLAPNHKVQLNSDTTVELTHESLMRLWPRLQNWMREEAESVIMYKHLAEASKSYQRGQERLLKAPLLQQALVWQEKHKPSLEWAQRYNTAFERTMQYIIKSREEYDYEEIAEHRKSGRVTRYTRNFAVIAVLLFAVSVFFIFDFSELLFEVQDQTEVPEQIDAHGDVQSDIADINNGLFDTDQILPDQTMESTQQRPYDNRTSDEQVTVDERIPDEVPVARDQVISEPSVTPYEEVIPPAILPDPEEKVSSRIFPANPEEDQAREEISRRRMASVSPTLAAISQKIEGETDLKALLTLQAHIFNEKYRGASYNRDIYSSLIALITDIYPDNYNAYNGHTESVNSVVFRPNSSIFYSASSDGRVMQWDVNNRGEAPKTLIQNQVVYNSMVISPNAQWLAIATDGMGVKVFNPGRNNPNPIQINWGNNRVVAIVFYPDNEHILFAGSDNELVKYNFRSATNNIVATLDSEVLSLALSPDGEKIVAGTRSGQVIMLSDDNNDSVEILHTDQGNDVLALSFNAAGSRVASGSLRGEVRILEVSDGDLLATLRGHSARVVDIAFCPQNKFIATSSFDGTVHLWDAQNFSSPPLVISDHGSWVRTVAFNTRGDKMVTGSRQESRLLSWTVDANEMASMICEKITRSLTPEEWNQYIGEDIPYMESCPLISSR